MDRQRSQEAGRLDPRIGVLNSGKFYAYAAGYNAQPTIGRLDEVEIALGLRRPRESPAADATPIKNGAHKCFAVLVRFEHPAWDEREGIEYRDITASSKREANSIVRRRAFYDGHTLGRRAWFTATEQ